MTSLVVRSAGFSPVKGMRHAAHDRVALDEQGAVGDRAFCLVDPARAQVLRTVQHPELIAVVARLDDGVLSMALPTGDRVEAEPHPTGERIACDYWGRTVDLALLDGPHAGAISEMLGRAVRLAAAPPGAVVFGAPVTVVGTGSLRAVSESIGEEVDPARFRATLVVETDEAWVEDTWLGEEVDAGSARLRIGGPVPRCAVIDHHPVTGAKDLRILKLLTQQRPTNRAGEPMFGVYAEVLTSGVVRQRSGDVSR
ncbi:MOSC domain-containing protein [Nocardioides currus]|uniref:MOSC domain-containing protein n=1 Tax=Nocardioides currus TaxID=2133958 RepID=A0A2R7Z1E4_9ACTN|nr:MOSC domain-containing protein [Nocardioides currus]PUA82442.1 hypothetical protein C7S10_01435 [Nocardioides currus]